jgi:hypothetical protein
MKKRKIKREHSDVRFLVEGGYRLSLSGERSAGGDDKLRKMLRWFEGVFRSEGYELKDTVAAEDLPEFYRLLGRTNKGEDR